MLYRIRDYAYRGIESGLHLGVQGCVMQDGKVLDSFALGEASEGVSLTEDSMMLWMSSGKPLTSFLLAKAHGEGLFDPFAPLVSILPEFTGAGKSTVTTADVLTHRIGLRHVKTHYPKENWAKTIAALCAADLEVDWNPSKNAGYDPRNSWFLLAEIAQRIYGGKIENLVKSHICEPLGMSDIWLGMPIAVYQEYAEEGFFPEMPTTAFNPWRQTQQTSLDAICAPKPGGNMVGPAWQWALFYEALRQNTGDLWAKDSVTLWTQRHREGVYDQTFSAVVDFGFGLVLDSKRYCQALDTAARIPYGYGKYASDNCFGHSGFQSSTAFCDPDIGLVVALAFNGFAGEKQHHLRQQEAIHAIYEEL